jgi:hypothetical protein
MPSIEAFFEALGTNSSDWAVLPSDAEDETLNEELLVESPTSPSNNPVANSLVARNGECTDYTGWNRLICERIPASWVVWTSMAGLLIWYAPSVLDRWLDDIAVLAAHGVNMQRRYARLRNEQEGPARRGEVTDVDVDADVIFFKVEQPLSGGLQRRHVDEDGAEYDLHTYIDWTYDTRTGLLDVQGASASFAGPGAPQVVEGGVITRRQSDDYNILITVERMSTATTIAPPSCVARTPKTFLRRSSENPRHSY